MIDTEWLIYMYLHFFWSDSIFFYTNGFWLLYFYLINLHGKRNDGNSEIIRGGKRKTRGKKKKENKSLFSDKTKIEKQRKKKAWENGFVVQVFVWTLTPSLSHSLPHSLACSCVWGGACSGRGETGTLAHLIVIAAVFGLETVDRNQGWAPGAASPTPSVLVGIHPSTNRDQGIRDSGYLYWFYVLSCCMPGSLIFVEIANSPKEMSRAFNLCWCGQYRNPAPSAPCYCTEPESFLRFHDTNATVKNGIHLGLNEEGGTGPYNAFLSSRSFQNNSCVL